MTPRPALLGRLARSKLLTRWSTASVGIGERQSREKGPGIEFSDHRTYQPGDDLRHVDPHLLARFNRHYVRQYDVYKQLPITILIDASRSMDFGEPRKFEFAQRLAAVFGFVGLAGGDQVQLGVGAGERIYWSPHFHGAQRAQQLFDWISAQKLAASGDFGATLRAASRHVTYRGLVILLSDWWSEHAEAELGGLAAAGQEIWGLHVVTRDEIEPAGFGEGEVRFVDMESGHEVELALDRTTLERYRSGFGAWSDQLSSVFTRANGRYVLVSTDKSEDRFFIEEARHLGLLG